MLNDQTTTAAPAPETDAAAAAAAEPTTTPDAASAEQLEQLLVLSQAPLSLDDALQQEAERTDDVAPLTAGRLLRHYGGLLALFLGVGLITAAVRHYADAPKLYLGLALAGAAVFAAGSIVVEPRSRRAGVLGTLRYGVLSATVGLGFGLLVGGIIHFSAFPHTGAVLVPLGLALSAGVFIARDGRALVGGGLMSAGVTVAGLLVWLGVGLGLLAKKLDPAPTPAAAAHGVVAGEHGEGAAEGHGEAGAHGAAAAGDHGTAAAHGAASAEAHGAAASDAHGETAEHGDAAATAEHGATAAKADHAESSAAGEHEATAAKSGHGASVAKAEHGESAAGAHGAATAKADHGDSAAAEHGESVDHGASTSSHAEEEEDEVTAADVLAPKKKSH